MKFLDKVKNGYKAVEFAAKKHSPEILTGVGIVAIIGGAIWLVKASFKTHDILEDAKTELDNIELSKEEMSDEEYKHDTNLVKRDTVIKIAKEYTGPVITISTGVGCLLGSNAILKKRNIELTGAYVALNTAYNKCLKEMEQKTIVEKEIDENGNEVEKEKTIYTWPNPAWPAEIENYRLIFIDENCRNVNLQHPLYTASDLRSIERMANRLLEIRKHLFINDVRDLLGLERLPSNIGWRWGWVYCDNGKNPFGDNFISFGISNEDAERDIGLRRFLDGDEKYVYIKLNVQGPVADFMGPADFYNR